MDLIAVLLIAIRRWYIVLAVLFVTAVMAATVPPAITSTYMLSSSIHVTAPYFSNLELQAQFNQNPYSDLSTAGFVVSQLAGSDQVKAELAAQNLSTDYRVDYSGGPIITITINSDTNQLALDTYSALIAEVNKGLVAKEDALGVPPPLRVVVDPVVQPLRATEVRGSAAKVMIGIFAVGFIASFGAAILFDGVRKRRKEGKKKTRTKASPAQQRRRPAKPPHIATKPRTSTRSTRSKPSTVGHEPGRDREHAWPSSGSNGSADSKPGQTLAQSPSVHEYESDESDRLEPAQTGARVGDAEEPRSR